MNKPDRTRSSSSEHSEHMTAPKRVGDRPTTFMFIDSSNGGVNAKPDKDVRSFVMKSARNKKAWSTKPNNAIPRTSTQLITQQTPTSRTRPGKKHARTSSCSAQKECKTSLASRVEYGRTRDSYDTGQLLAVTYGIGSKTIGFVASFDCLAVRLDTHAQGFLHKFVESTAPCLLPLDIHKSSNLAARQWMSACIQSPVGASFIYAALTTSLRAANLEYDMYKWRAVAAVNEILTEHTNNIDDTTIASVLMLLAFEESEVADPRKKGDDRRHSISMNNAHLDGLRKMVEQVGGLAALNGNRCLQAFILMHSIAQSIATFNRPYVLLQHPNGYIDDYASLSTQPRPVVSRIVQQFHDLGVSSTLLDIIGSITIFILDLSAWYSTGVCPVDALELQKHASLLMYRLFDWYDRIPQDGSHATSQSVCLALLIFMTHATEPSAPSFGLRLWKAVGKLRSSLQQSPLSHWASVPNLLIWTLTMGALSAQDLSQTGQSSNAYLLVHFFTQRLALVSKISNLDTATAACTLSRLRTCIWIPSVFDEQVTRLWVAIRLCRVGVLNLDEMSATNDGDGDQIIENQYALGQSTTARFFSTSRIPT